MDTKQTPALFLAPVNSDEITFSDSDPTPDDDHHWPSDGQQVQGWLTVEVEEGGFEWSTPYLTFYGLTPQSLDPSYVSCSCEGLDLAHLLGGVQNFPIASGVYLVRMKFWYESHYDYWSGHDEPDYGWNLLECKFLGSNLQVVEVLDPTGTPTYELGPIV